MGEKDNDTQHARLRHGGRQAGMRNLLAPDTPIWVDFWIFSDQAQLLDPESAASKEPRSGLVA